jgi:hypothetical protein
MAQDLTSVQWANPQSNLTDEQKAQARENIASSQISYNNALTDMSITKEVIRPNMNTKYTATIGDEDFLLMPGRFADGMVVKNNGSLETRSMPETGDKFDIVQEKLSYNASNTTILDKIYIGTDYKEYIGNIGFTTSSSGSMSICALDANEHLIYGDQCVNFSGPSTGISNFIPFSFKETGTDRIAFICIKGSSNGNASITHLFYLGKKDD